MTRDDIIKLYEKANGWSPATFQKTMDELERFAALVVEAELRRLQEEAIEAEREACARVLDEMADDMAREMEPSTAIAYVRSKAAAIRARGEKK